MKGIPHEMVFYRQGFFGYGEKGDFRQWSLAHLLPCVLLVLAILLLYRKKDAIRRWKHEEDLRFGIVVLMLLFEMSYFWRLLYVGPSANNYPDMMTYLPLQVCQWTLLTTSLMMAKKSKVLFEMDFFLTLSVGILPLLFPAVISSTGPTYFRYYQFWGEHLLPIFSVFYVMVIHDFKPEKKGMLYAYLMLLLMAPFAIYANFHIENAHYMYLTNTTKFPMLSFLPQGIITNCLLFNVVIWALFLFVWFIYSLTQKGKKPTVSRDSN